MKPTVGKIRFFVDGVNVLSLSDGYKRVCPKCGGLQKLELRAPIRGKFPITDQPRCCRGGGR